MNPNHTTGPNRFWAYAGTILGGVVSVAANVAHSFIVPAGAPQGWHPEPGAVVGAMAWPFFLFVAVEILARYAFPQGFWWAVLRFCGLIPVALVAAFVSYRHLSGLLTHYGEDPLVSLVGPLAVDGLMVMATGALLATNVLKRRAEATASAAAATTTATTAAPSSDAAPVKPRTPRKATTAKTAAPAKKAVSRKPTTAKTRPADAESTPAPAAVAVSAPDPTPAADPMPAAPPTAEPVAKPAASALDTPVTTADAAPLQPPVPAGLVARARNLAEQHHAANGAPITANELAVRLRVNSDTAAQILAVLALGPDDPTRTVSTVNGAPVSVLR